MKILYVADGRSPTARNWIGGFIERGHDVHLATTFVCEALPGVVSMRHTPVAFSQMKKSGAGGAARKARAGIGALTRARQLLGPLTIPGAAPALTAHIEEVQPDIVHALRIPYEGMLAAAALKDDARTKLILSVWGNDFTLHAPATPLMAVHTRRALRRADALLADAARDLRLARQWGLADDAPAAVFPGGGGIRPEVFYPPAAEPAAALIINPRGLRAYVRNDVFFAAAARVHAARPDVRFACPAMQSEPQAEAWVAQHGLAGVVELLPKLSQAELAGWFRRALIVCSPSEHDGTPNTLLEALACGCFPVAGDIESLHEWITPGENGLLLPPADAGALAAALLHALDDSALRARAREHNARLVAERASYAAVMAAAEAFVTKLV
ncbi:MAG: glycosyltransferase [Anaerolineae bacterium]|nr:MAG: glycosyltransferase [Anaerolineae bacterium]